MEDKRQKKSDSLWAYALIGTVYALGMWIFGLVINKNFDWIYFVIGVLSLILLIYLLKKTKFNLNERYEDERKTFISEKSSSSSYNILFGAIVLFEYLISSNRIVMTTDHALNLIIMSVLFIKFSTYLIYKYKY